MENRMIKLNYHAWPEGIVPDSQGELNSIDRTFARLLVASGMEPSFARPRVMALERVGEAPEMTIALVRVDVEKNMRHIVYAKPPSDPKFRYDRDLRIGLEDSVFENATNVEYISHEDVVTLRQGIGAKPLPESSPFRRSLRWDMELNK
jgi:hypothetical protein